MDAFETVIASILQRKGFWTLTSVKVDLTKAEKRAIGRHSSPRWELDIVAYRGRDNELRVVECKSFLDSPGVECGAFDGTNRAAESRYKLFCDSNLRKVVLRRLVVQLTEAGFCRKAPSIKLCLAAGKVRGDSDRLRQQFEKRGWVLLGPAEIRVELKALRDSGYENSVAAVVTKIILRDGSRAKSKRGIDADV